LGVGGWGLGVGAQGTGGSFPGALVRRMDRKLELSGQEKTDERDRDGVVDVS
jgi:hypothetical protein